MSRRTAVAALLASTAWYTPAMAQLTGGHVVAGQAIISQPSANSTLIQQLTPKAIINWTGFSIPSGASVTYQQLNSSSIALNRVFGGNPSLILGKLSANGQVWLINPAGIVVGSGGVISAAGVLLSTANIHNADFLSGNYSFDSPGRPGAGILNQGTITASAGGSVVLAGTRATNDGLIAAELGSVVVAGASTYSVDFAGDGLLSFAITAPAAHALVTNTGKISAPGGLVLMTAQAAKGVLDNVINTSGIVEATSAANVDGKIVLAAEGGGTAVSGTLDASGKGAGQTGGTVEVLGDSVTLTASAAIDVSGAAGGGTALVGGNFHGAGPQANAQTTSVAAGSIIDADAIVSGNGGRVAIWSDDSTTVAGSITARGGAAGGNGGYVETSGGALSFAGTTVDLSAPRGQTGTWLLDPYDLTIGAQGASAIAAALATASVIVETGPFSASSAFGVVNTAGNGDITVASAITWSSANSLTLSAFRNINILASITDSVAGSVTLHADNTGTNTGTIIFNNGAQIATTGAVSFFYNPTSYAAPTIFTGDVTNPGSLTAYMLVNTPADLQNVQNNLAGTYALGTDILSVSSTIANFTPIGNVATPFIGTFDGQGFIIDSIAINSALVPSTGDVGLFGNTSGATIRNVGLTNVNYTATSGSILLGALIGSAVNTQISNAYSTGNVTSSSAGDVGGLVGQTDTLSQLSNTHSTAQVMSGGPSEAGGLVGFNNGGLITTSYATGSVTVTGGTAGGLVGTNNGTVQISFATGNTSGDEAGGLVGSNNAGATIHEAYATGTSTANNEGGGLAGINQGAITESYAIGFVTTSAVCSDDCFTGGLVGFNGGLAGTTIVKSFALGTVDANGEGGGLVGENNGAAITQSYEAGPVFGSGDLGALIGDNVSGGTADAASHWDTTTNTSLAGIGTGSAILATGLTTAQLQVSPATLGWDPTVWAQNSSGTIPINGAFPYLQWSLETVTGTTYSDRGATPLPGADVQIYVDGGGEIADVISDAGGAYTAMFVGSGSGLLANVNGGEAPFAETFYDGLTPGTVHGVDLYGNYVKLISGAGSFSAVVEALGPATPDIGTLYFAVGNTFVVSAGTSVEIDSSGKSFVLDGATGTGTSDLALSTFASAGVSPATLFTQTQSLASNNLFLLGTGNYVLTNGGNNFTTLAVNAASADVFDSAELFVAGTPTNPGGITVTGALVLSTPSSIESQPTSSLTGNTDTLTFTASGTVLLSPTAVSSGGAVIATANSPIVGSPSNGSVQIQGFNTAIGGASGGFVSLDVVGGTGSIYLENNIVTAAAAVTFTGTTLTMDISAPTVGIDTTNGGVASSGANVTFAGPIGRGPSPPDNLTITAGTFGVVNFQSTIGAVNPPIGALTVTGEEVLLGHSVTTTGAVSFGAPVLLTGNVAIDTTNSGATTGANVGFASTVDATTAGVQTLQINAGSAGTVAFAGNLGGSTPLGAITLTDATLDIGANASITTSNAAFSQAGPTVLEGAGATASTVATANGAIAFGGTIDGTVSGDQALVLNAGSGVVTLDGALGGVVPLGAVTVDAGGLALGANITTNGGGITFNAPVVLETSVVLNANSTGSATGGAAVTFASTLDGAFFNTDNLTITAGTVAANANVNFEGRVGTEYFGVGGAGVTLGAVDITSANNVNLSMPFGANGDGFSAASFTIAGAGNTPGAATLTASSFIGTITGGTAGPVDIVTTGNVSIGLDLFSAGNVGSPAGGNGGAVIINAGGSISIGASLAGTAALAGDESIETSGGSPTTSSATAGNGGAVTLTGASVTLPQGVNAAGADALVGGSTVNGGAGGAIALTATAGNVTVGSAATGTDVVLEANGGNSLGGSGGAGANVTLTGTTVSVTSVEASGGNAAATSGVSGGNAGDIVFVASAANGPAVILFGTSNTTSPLPITTQGNVTLHASGGLIGDTLITSSGATGTVSGAAGAINIEGGLGGAPLNGTSFIELTNSPAPPLGGGPTVVVLASGGVGHGGTITFRGPVQATTGNVESLLLDASNGSATFFGAVGSSVPLNTLALGFLPSAGINVAFPAGSNGGAITFEGPITAATQFVDQRTTGPLTLDAGLTTKGGAVTFDAPVVLGGTVAINTASGVPAGANVTFANTLDGASAYADGLTIAAGSGGNVGFAGTVGGTVVLGPVSITGANVNLTMLTGFSAASVAVTATSFSELSGFLSTAGQVPGSNANGGAVNINTIGGVTIGETLFTDGGVTAGGLGGNGGAITINAGGAVAIGTNLSLSTTGSGATLLQSDSSVFAAGYDATAAGQSPGNGGAISISGSSINLPLGVFSRGGEEEVAGSTNAGGNAGTLTLTATATSVTIGIPNVTGNAVFASAAGGDSTSGPGGNGAAATIMGQTISLSNLHTSGGESTAASGTAASGGDITLIATASSGAAVTLYGNADSPITSSPSYVTLGARGSVYGATLIGPTTYTGGTVTGLSGDITIEGGAAGAPLNGTSFVQLASGGPAALNGGATVEIGADAPVGGGAVVITGPIEGAAANAQSLHLPGLVNFSAPVGNLVPLNTLAIGVTGGNVSAVFQSTVTATEIDILSPAGTVTFDGVVTTPDFTMAAGTTTLALLGGSDFTGTETFSGAAVEIDGTITSPGMPLVFSTPIVLEGATTIDTTNGGGSPAGASVTFGNTLDDASALAENLTITAGGGLVSFDGRVGRDGAGIGTTLGNVAIATTGSIVMSVAPGANNDGFSAAAITTNSGSLAVTSYLSTRGANSAVFPTNGGPINITTTAGDVDVGGDLISSGGVNTSTGVGGNGGTITVNAGGNVNIGTALALTTSGSGAALVSTDSSVFSAGYDATAAGQTAGNGAAISITGANINLPVGVFSRGGHEEVAGSTNAGGNAAPLTLTATGNVTIGIPTGANATGNAAIADAGGGDSPAGTPGSGAAITITGNTITLAKAITSAGASTEAAGPAANGGALSLIATATSGAAVTLYGEADAPATSATSFVTLASRGSLYGAIQLGVDSYTGGTFTGTSGNIEIASTSAGAPLNGSSFVQLATSTASALNGGSTVFVQGGTGTVLISGPIEATTANVESLHVRGVVTLDGPVGDLVALSTVAAGSTFSTTSNTTFDSSVNANTQIALLAPTGLATFDGLVTTPDFTMAAGSLGVEFLGGANFSGPVTLSGGPVTLAGTISLSGASPGLSIAGATTLMGATVLNSAPVNGPITLGTVDGANALSISTGSGATTFGNAVGGSTALTTLSVTSGTIIIDTTVTTSASQTYNGAVQIGAAGATLTGVDITVNGTIDGPGALTISDPPPTPVVTITGAIGANTALASFTVNSAPLTINLKGSVTTVGAQTYMDTTLNLGGTDYQTDGAPFSESGSTLITSPSPALDSVTIDTTGNGAAPAGAAVNFASPGSIDAASSNVDAALDLSAGTGGNVTVGLIGAADPLQSLTVTAASFTTPSPPDVIGFFNFTQFGASSSSSNSPSPSAPPPVANTSLTSTTASLVSTTTELTVTTGVLASAPPPPSADNGGPASTPTDNSDNGGTPFLTSVTDLDSGSTNFATITGSNNTGGSANPDPIAIIAPITPATQPVAQPAVADTSVGGPNSHLFVHKTEQPHVQGVPGITDWWPMFGNRGLWFANILS